MNQVPVLLSLSFALAGCAPEPTPVLFTDPESLDFASADTRYRPRISASVGNAGNATAGITELTVEGDGAEYVRVVVPTLPADLGPGGRLGFAIELIAEPPTMLASQLRVSTEGGAADLVVPLLVSMVGELPSQIDNPPPPEPYAEVWTEYADLVQAIGDPQPDGTIRWEAYFAESAAGSARVIDLTGEVSECGWFLWWEEGWDPDANGLIEPYREGLEHSCDFDLEAALPPTLQLHSQGVEAGTSGLDWWRGDVQAVEEGWFMEAGMMETGDAWVYELP